MTEIKAIKKLKDLKGVKEGELVEIIGYSSLMADETFFGKGVFLKNNASEKGNRIIEVDHRYFNLKIYGDIIEIEKYFVSSDKLFYLPKKGDIFSVHAGLRRRR